MFVSFESMAGSSRVWIYQIDKKLTPSQKDILSNALYTFTEAWQVHGQPMKTSFAIRYDQFVVLAADEDFNTASGCSIDGSVRTLKELGAELGLDFFNRNLAAFKKDEAVVLIPLTELKKKYAEGVWNAQTLYFNNLAPSVESLADNWIVPAGNTWLKRYLSTEKVTS